ncbi:TRAP transporter small permease [Marinivivus vitaminiproducens]|uniref:TRAP transporter small permease n=1 Tax=Marinivivus vitaminiproducens TaxID=3035935 RepID=UPI0027A25432|nr:TRAP transporter small permease subunit [Geminicoccaceae bacterium SCSIO 64248]
MLGLAHRLLDALAALLLVAVLVVTTTQVVARYVLGLATPWSEELTRLLFIWLVFIGASRARHMNIDILPSALAPRSARTLQIGSALFGAALVAFLAVYGLGLVDLTAYDRFTALGISVQYLYWALVVGGVLWIVLGLADVLMAPADEPALEEPPETMA